MRMKLIFIDVSVMFLNEILNCETELPKTAQHVQMVWYVQRNLKRNWERKIM